MEKIKIHIDTDIGTDVDDLCAIAYLLKREDVTVTGITTCLDYQGRRTKYVKKVLELCQMPEIPIGAGEDGTIDKGVIEDSLFATEGMMFGSEIIHMLPSKEKAEEILENSLAQGAVIVAIGPLTNIARLILKNGNGNFDINNLFWC